tara:strand:+ start:1581 stop:3311 length:1731 start_codon:yes stop_codon:yes gene_type:complete
MKSCLLIYPPNSSLYAIKHQRDELYYSEEPVVIPSGLLWLASYCLNNGNFNFRILNLSYEYAVWLEYFNNTSRKNKKNNNEFDYEGLVLNILREKCSEHTPDVIGISALFDHSLGHVKMMASMIKEISDDIIVVSGGNAATNRTKELLETDVDGVARGHGEEPLLELLQADDSKNYINKSIKWSTQKNGINNLSLFTKYNELSPLRWNLLEINDYQRFLGCGKGFFQQNNNERRIIHLTSSRGCPFKCVFCSSHSVNGYKLYYYYDDQFLNEVKFVHEEYGINIVAIEDDSFNINKKRAIKILRGIKDISKDIEIEFNSGFVLQLLDEEFVAALKDCNINWIQVAIESGSPEVLKNIIHKPLDLNKGMKNLELLQKYDLYVRAFFILGFPGETKEQMQETIDFMNNAKINWNGIGMAKPISGSELEKICKDNDFIHLSSDNMDMTSERKACISTPEFTPQEVDEIVYNANIYANFVNNYDLYRGGTPENAIVGFDNVLTRDPEHLFALYYRSVAYNKLKDTEKASESLVTANKVMKNTNKWNKLVKKYELMDLDSSAPYSQDTDTKPHLNQFSDFY